MGFIIAGIFILIGVITGIAICKRAKKDSKAGKKDDFFPYSLIFAGLPFLIGIALVDATICNIDNIYRLKENCYKSYSDISVNAGNMIKSADTILIFTNKNTDAYKEIMNSITEARNSNYSSTSITHLINVIHENYPTDMEMGELWKRYVEEIDEAYTKILEAQVTYNESVKEYKYEFKPSNKIWLMFLVEEDTSVDYYKININIDYN